MRGMILICLLSLPLIAWVVEAELPLSSSELKKFGVHQATVSKHQHGYLPEADGPYGDETPDYLVEYYEKEDLVVLAYGYGWGFIEDSYVFPMRKQPSDKCEQCFILMAASGEDIEVGEGVCDYQDNIRKSCRLSFAGDNYLGEHTEVDIAYGTDSSGKLAVKSLQTRIFSYSEIFSFGDQDNQIIKR